MEPPDWAKSFAGQYFRSFIESYLETGKISKDDPIDKVKSLLSSDPEYKKRYEDITIVTTFTSGLIDSIQLELTHHHYNQAVILALTYIEHSLNEFYIDYMSNVLNMSNSQLEPLLKCNGISEKISGLFYLTFRENFPSQLKSSIETIKKCRNGFIHYKFHGVPLEEIDSDKIWENTKDIAQTSPTVLQELDEFLDSMEIKLYPNRKIAQDLVDEILKGNKNGQAENADGE